MAKRKPTKPAPSHPADPTLADPRRFAEISRRFEIDEIALVRTSAEQSFEGEPSELNVSISFAVRRKEQSDDALKIIVSLRLEGVQDNEGRKETKLQIDADFRLVYRQSPGPDLSDDALADFANLNGRFNVWPYWREYVQNTMARMSLPPLTIPLMKVRSARPPKEAASGSDE